VNEQSHFHYKESFRSSKEKEKKNWCFLFGTQRVETEGVSNSEGIDINPKADSHPGTNQA
jgi:hypothetical protein